MATLTKAQMSLYAMAAGFPDPSLMAEVGYAESGGDTKIVNSIGAVGVLQINQPVHVKDHPSWSVAHLQNPLNNFVAGKVLWDADIKAGGDGLGPWADSKDKGNGGGWGKTQAYKNFAHVSTTSSSDSTLNDIGQSLASPVTSVAAPVMSLTKIVQSAAKWISNPISWLHVTYVVVGGVLMIGVSVSMVKNTSAGQSAIRAAKQVKNVAVSKAG